jgi:ABC-type anion transport system duplicated permease subunit
MRSRLVFVIVVVPGGIGAILFAAYAWQDWIALQRSYQHFETIAQYSTDMSELFIAEAKQNIHRMNLFAEGVWALLSAIYAAIGLVGCHLPARNPSSAP